MIFASAEMAGSMSMILMMAALFAIMYFMMIRPQKKERKRIQEMQASMEVGDAVVTTGGFYGILIDVGEEDVIVEFGSNRNCRIPMKKEAIAQIEKPGQAAAAALEKKEEKKDAKKDTKK